MEEKHQGLHHHYFFRYSFIIGMKPKQNKQQIVQMFNIGAQIFMWKLQYRKTQQVNNGEIFTKDEKIIR